MYVVPTSRASGVLSSSAPAIRRVIRGASPTTAACPMKGHLSNERMMARQSRGISGAHTDVPTEHRSSIPAETFPLKCAQTLPSGKSQKTLSLIPDSQYFVEPLGIGM